MNYFTERSEICNLRALQATKFHYIVKFIKPEIIHRIY